MATIWKRRAGEMTHAGAHAEATTTLELFSRQMAVCTLCGDGEASGWWRGVEADIRCCRCALTAIPALLADTLAGEYPLQGHTSSRIQHQFTEFRAAFEHALGLAYLRIAEMDRAEAVAKAPRKGNGVPGLNGRLNGHG
jgi:hypothetical protein